MTSETKAPCRPPGIVIAGSASGVGKSSLAVGLMAALSERGKVVQAFKVGPDFVDPLYHGRATGRPSINLDRWFSSPTALKKSWERYSSGSDFFIIEGTTGLLDDIGCPKTDDGAPELLPYNTAQLAKWLDVPVVLVMDGSKLENSIGALVRGYCTWDDKVEICGIIFNNVRDHDDLADLESIVYGACPSNIPILGGVPNDDTFLESELESAFDASVINKKILNLSSLVSQHIDVDKIVNLARAGDFNALEDAPHKTEELQVAAKQAPGTQGHHASKNARKKARKRRAKLVKSQVEDHREAEQSHDESDNASCSASHSTDIAIVGQSPCKVAVAKDSAFNFYYEENLDLMRDNGMEIVYFSPLTDALPPNISAVYLGGGVPELHASQLADNKIFRAGMRKFVEAGGIVFAEGGGLLVLCQSLQTRTGFPQQPMIGIFPFRAIMSKTKVMRGYVEVTVGENCPIFTPGSTIRGFMNSNSELVQEQHIGGIVSTSEWKSTYVASLFEIKNSARSYTINDGYSTSNVLGSYFHHHFGNSPEVLKYFVEKCQQVNVSAVTNAVGGARRTAEFLEGSVAYTPPLTPISSRTNFGMMGVHSSPELNLERRARSRPQSLDLNGLQYDFSALAMPDRRFHLTKTQSSGSLGHRTITETAGFEHKSGAASPVQLGSASDLSGGLLPGRSHFMRTQDGRVDFDYRHNFPRVQHEKFQHRLSNNNSECLSSDGSELAERSSSGLLNSYKPVENIVQNAGKFQEVGNQFFRQAAQYLDIGTPGPYGEHSHQKSIAVCDPGVRDIIQAFNVQASRLIDVSRNGLGSPIISDRSFGMLQSKSVQALQNLHARRNSSDAGSESSFGEGLIENMARSIYRRSVSGLLDIDFEAIAQVKPDVLIFQEDKGTDEIRYVMEKVSRVSIKTRVLGVSPHTLSDIMDVILKVGDAINERDQAVTIVKKLRERLRKVVVYSQKAQINLGDTTRPKIVVLGSLHPLSVQGGWVNDLIGLVGGEPMPLHGQKKKVISWEDLVQFAPSVLIICAPVMNCGDKSAKVFNDLCDIAAQPGWWQLPAVRDGVVVICEEALLSRMGLRLIDGAEALARIVYGDHVPTCCLPRSAFKLKLRPGQRVRPRLLPNYFMAYA